jgi:uncharacterized protein (TIGR03086 family)
VSYGLDMATDDAYDALDRATAGFHDVLVTVSDAGWDRPTPNPGWSVRDLVSHVIGGNRRYVVLLSGAPTVEVEKLRGGDHLGDDPIAAFDETSMEVAKAFREPGALERTVHHRKGDRTGDDLLTMRILEHSLHGWDLATAIDGDTNIDPTVVKVLLERASHDLLVRSGYPGDPEPGSGTGAKQSPQQRLLVLTGRG